MSLREDRDRNKSCPSRGLGLAAAAIGVGVGAAFFYFFNKRSQNPNGEGSTTEWECEQSNALDEAERLRDQQFRERSWSPEDCSICFDVMVDPQEVVSLPCTHRFHQRCIVPWLRERSTCPYCRKPAEQ